MLSFGILGFGGVGTYTILGAAGEAMGIGLSRSEQLINSSIERKEGGLEKLNVKNPWFKFVNEKQGNYYYDSEIENISKDIKEENIYFDIWESNPKEIDSNKGEWDAVKRMVLWFVQCQGARAWIVGNSEIKGSFTSNNRSSTWIDPNLKREIQEVDPEILKKSATEVQLNNKSKSCQNGETLKGTIYDGEFSTMTKNKIDSLPKRKGWVIFFEKGDVVATRNNTNIESQRKLRVYLPGVVLEQKNTNWINRKVRIVHIEKGDDVIYVDEWVEPFRSSDMENFRLEIGKKNSCKISSHFDEDEDNSKLIDENCRGTFIKKEIDWRAKKNNIKEFEYFTSGGEYWKKTDNENQGLYGEEAGQLWDQLKDKVEKDYVWWRREIGISWNGKIFKWRSF